ncbi:MAG: hypothetical protein L6V91_08420 [Bacilli bacterium]|nr:MAG: hypothetical protein L6V91_08420 [Bacilli bacterium]
MQQFTDVIMQFGNKMGYLRSKRYRGHYFSMVVIKQGSEISFSDIDLHIIFNNNLKRRDKRF